MTKKMMKNAIAWFEIPATKLERAKTFYQKIFEIEMIDMDMDQLKMSMFPVEESGIGGAICEHEEYYRPGYNGPLIYLNAGPDLQLVLDRVEKAGGVILQPKTQITEEYGYMAMFEDTEGNRVALHSMN